MLLEFGPDLTIVNEYGWSPLHAGADNLEVTKLLVGKGANTNFPKLDMWTPLHLATFWNKPDIVRFLLENRGDPNLLTDDGKTGLHLAAGEQSVRMVTDMLKYGTKVNQQDSSGRTALHLALKNRSSSLDLIQLLIDNGANAMLKTKDNVSCYILAVDRGDPKILDAVLPKTTSPSDPTWEPEDLAPAFWKALELHAKSVEPSTTARLK